MVPSPSFPFLNPFLQSGEVFVIGHAGHDSNSVTELGERLCMAWELVTVIKLPARAGAVLRYAIRVIINGLIVS
jgi:hypothetical protein